MTDKFRIEDKENVRVNGRKATSYDIFERHTDEFGRPEHVRAGGGFAPGWNASDEQCIADFFDDAE